MAGAEQPARYSAFISYSHRDHQTARWLHKALETYRLPSGLVGMKGEYGEVPRRVGRVFRDEEELPGAAELGPKLQDALLNSAVLIVICSPQAVASKWVGQEIALFRTVNPGRPVLALICNGVPGTDRECFPENLRFGVSPEGVLDRTKIHEPLAPDLQKLDKDTVKLKLIAGLFGIGYGDLAQRDIKRAHRQMAFAGGLATAVIAALAILSVVAVSYARMAVTQRDVARQQRQIAERNAEEAERKAWLANVAAQEVRREADLIDHSKRSPVCVKVKSDGAAVT